MSTTIQISESLREKLISVKQDKKETYEEIISKLLKNFERKKQEEENLLKEGYMEMYEDLITLDKEWEGAQSEWPEY